MRGGTWCFAASFFMTKDTPTFVDLFFGGLVWSAKGLQGRKSKKR
jgi:hypothetical protein